MGKFNFKKTSFILIILALSVLITACGGWLGNESSKEEGGEHICSFSEWTTVEPTCTKSGSRVDKCDCGETKTTTLPSLGHGKILTRTENHVDANCFHGESYDLVSYCEVCLEEQGRETVTIDNSMHTPGDEVVTIIQSVSCTTDGIRLVTVKCDACGILLESSTEKTASLGHTPGAPVKEKEKKPTCTSEGEYYMSTYCTVCGDMLESERVAIDAKGHTKTSTSKQNVVEPTCTSPGSYDEVTHCHVCKSNIASNHVDIEPIAHTESAPVKENASNFGTDYELVVYCNSCRVEMSREFVYGDTSMHTPGRMVTTTKAASCSEEGYTLTTNYCQDCDFIVSQTKTAIPKKAHTPQTASSTTITPATCTESGLGERTKTCKICGEDLGTETYTIAARGHSYGASETVTIAATCTTDGTSTRQQSCTKCSDVKIIKQTTLSATGHSEKTTNENQVQPTCTTSGGYSIVVSCRKCLEVLNVTEVVLAATGHTESAAVTENEKSPTCTTLGSYDTVIYCAVCSAELSRTTHPVDKLPHTPTEAVTENYIGSSCTELGSYDLAVYCSECDTELSREAHEVEMIPHTFDFITCTVCGSEAECNDGVELVLNEDGKGYTVTSVYKCTDEVLYLISKDGIPVTSVERLSSSTAKTVIFGKDVAHFAENILFDTSDIIFLDGNEHFKIKDRVLYTADESYLVRFLGGEGYGSFTIDENTPEIYYNAFVASEIDTLKITAGVGIVPDLEGSNIREIYATDITSIRSLSHCSLLETVVILGSYKSFGQFSFRDCDSLKNLVVPASVTNISIVAFYEGKEPDNIYYMGSSVEEWKAVGGVTDLDSSVYYYTETKPLMPGDWWHFVGDVPTLWPPIPEGEGSKGLEYQINDDLASYTVVGYGTCTDSNLVIPETYNDMPVTAVNINKGIGRSFVETFVIPDSVTYVRSLQFYDYQKLRSVRLSANLTVTPLFEGCTALEEVDFGENSRITEICKEAFRDCPSLLRIDIPSSVVTIGDRAFADCDALREVVFAENACLELIDEYAFSNCPSLLGIDIPSSVITVGQYAFEACEAMEHVAFADNSRLESIDEGAFENLTSLKTVDFGENSILKTIGIRAFSYCTALEEINLPDGLTTIEGNAFTHCEAITTIRIPSSVTTIGSSIFAYCSNLRSAVFADGSPLAAISYGMFEDCTSLVSVDFGENNRFTEIGSSAFSGCTSLVSMDLREMDNLTEIGSYAFSGCTSLVSMDLREIDNLTEIGHNAFSGCTSLTSIIIPKTVTNLNYSLFDGCTSAIDLYYEGTEAEWRMVSGSGNIAFVNNLTIHYNFTE